MCIFDAVGQNLILNLNGEELTLSSGANAQ